jgi:para-aminobenzoate synthetase component 1
MMGLYDWVIAWDHDASRAWLISTGIPETTDSTRHRRAIERADAIRARFDSSSRRVRSNAPAEFIGGSLHRLGAFAWSRGLDLRSTFSREGYLAAVGRVRDYIRAGDIFQANLSQRFDAPLQEQPWEFYRRLRDASAAPCAAFLDLPHGPILSVSPERFLRVNERGQVETRPIKGTRPRGATPAEDIRLAEALRASAKDQAENLMIVDLMRNDLSRVCAPGSVRVAALSAVEHYPTVHHLVSTIVGTLEEGKSPFDLLRAAFPAGSITGAPKLRAMEILAELEPCARKVYCGSIGYISRTGAMDTNVAIRTAVVSGGRLYFSAGGGIVLDSDPEMEYEETLHKARGFVDALASTLSHARAM